MVGFLAGADGNVEEILPTSVESISAQGNRFSVSGSISDILEEVRYHCGDDIPLVPSFL